MSLIQIGLVLGSMALLGLYFVFLRSTFRDRIISVLLFFAALVAILFPEWTTVVANFLGVGRGTDLLIYLFILASAFGFILLSTRILHLEDKITDLTREMAISTARKPADTAGDEWKDQDEGPSEDR